LAIWRDRPAPKKAHIALAHNREEPTAFGFSTGDFMYNTPVFAQVAVFLLVGFLAAAAVHFGFGAGFVDDALGYPIVAYAAVLAAALSRPGGSVALPLRLLCSVVLATVTLLLLRTVLLFTVPFGSFQTTGHTPAVALPISLLVAAAGQLLLLRVVQARSASK
jgi:hypothetical protein